MGQDNDRRIPGLSSLAVSLISVLVCTGCGLLSTYSNLRYQNDAVTLEGELYGLPVDYRGGEGEPTLAVLRGEPADRKPVPWMPEDTVARLREAIAAVREKSLPEEPEVVFASLTRRGPADAPRHYVLMLLWLEKGNDAVGIVTQRSLPDGEVLTEFYPCFGYLGPQWHGDMGERPLKSFIFGISAAPDGRFEDFRIPWRLAKHGERKDVEAWDLWLRATKRGYDIDIPPVWIPDPQSGDARIGVYTGAGHTSMVPLLPRPYDLPPRDR